jgi:hypothetical protein
MNLREGTRRLALLLGAVGAILGGYVSYLELQTVLNQRASHNKFEQLAVSEVVKQASKIDNNGKYSVYPPNPYEVNKGGVKAIDWTDYPGSDAFENVESIVTEDGQTLYPISAPSRWLYLLVAIFPIIGFFHPLGRDSRNRMGGSRFRSTVEAVCCDVLSFHSLRG